MSYGKDTNNLSATGKNLEKKPLNKLTNREVVQTIKIRYDDSNIIN